MPQDEKGTDKIEAIASILTAVPPGYTETFPGRPLKLELYTLLLDDSETRCLFRTKEKAERHVSDFRDVAEEFRGVKSIRVIRLSVNLRSFFELAEAIENE